MNTKMANAQWWIAVASLFLSPFAFAQGKLNLSAFKGRYNGTVAEAGPGGTTNGRATVVIAVPKHGKSARITYRATFSDGMGGTTVRPTSILLNANKKATVTDLLVGIAGENNAKRGKGRWSQRKRTLRLNATNGEGTTLRGKGTARDLRRVRKLNLTLASNDGVDTTEFRTALRARLPR